MAMLAVYLLREYQAITRTSILMVLGFFPSLNIVNYDILMGNIGFLAATTLEYVQAYGLGKGVHRVQYSTLLEYPMSI